MAAKISLTANSPSCSVKSLQEVLLRARRVSPFSLFFPQQYDFQFSDLSIGVSNPKGWGPFMLLLQKMPHFIWCKLHAGAYTYKHSSLKQDYFSWDRNQAFAKRLLDILRESWETHLIKLLLLCTAIGDIWYVLYLTLRLDRALEVHVPLCWN